MMCWLVPLDDGREYCWEAMQADADIFNGMRGNPPRERGVQASLNNVKKAPVMKLAPFCLKYFAATTITEPEH